VQGDEHAEVLAQAALDQRSAQSLVMWGTAAGDARLRPGVRVVIRGVAETLSGEHVLASVHHSFDPQHGYVSELSSALPAPRRRRAGTLLALGRVTRIDDPDRLGRVQVALISHGDIESDWLQLVGAGAGKGKGLVAQPDVGDRVLLLVDHADPAQAVVLGSLWGEEGLPEEQGGLGERGSFCFVTPGGHRLRLDDGERTVRIRGSAGSELEMGPERVVLHANAPMTIEAPGKTLTIRANAIELRRG
jgi:phage baseplate assembly protein gpV